MTSIRRPRKNWLPALFATVAAAAVILALFLPGKIKNPKIEPPIESPESSAYHLDTRIDIPVQVIQTLAPSGHWKGGEAIPEGTLVQVSTGNEIQVAIGADSTIEAEQNTDFSLFILDEQTHALDILMGHVWVSHPACSSGLGLGFEILVGEEVFTLLHGVVDIAYNRNGLKIRVIEGDVSHRRNERSVQLTKGTWHLDNGQMVKRRENKQLSTNGITDTASSVKKRRILERPVEREPTELPKRLIRETLARARPKLQTCYEQALKREPRLTLQVNARVFVESDGSISSVQASGLGRNPVLKECFSKTLKGLRFPPSKDGPLELVIPLQFYPE
jgi:hypothetical protein